MDKKLYNKTTLILTVIVAVISFLLLQDTPEFSMGLCLLTGIYFVIVLMRDYILKIDLVRISGTLYLSFQLVLVFALSTWSGSFVAQIFTLILIGEFTFHNSKNRSILFTVAGYACFILSQWIYYQLPSFEQISYVVPRMLEYFAIFGISHLAKIAFQQKQELTMANEQLRIAAIELEQKAKLQERTRISREIHDSVGHTLTSALTGLQTASHAIGKNNYSLSEEMINRTVENIRSGLDDVRSSVHMLRESHPDHSFIPELMKLINETKKQTSVEIDCDIDNPIPDLSPMTELTIYRALQEGLTNGIRHGSSTYFHFSLTYQTESIRFLLSDNGKSPSQIVYGFGLNAMKERVNEVGGSLSISNKNSASGLTLEMTLPIQRKTNERSEQIG